MRSIGSPAGRFSAAALAYLLVLVALGLASGGGPVPALVWAAISLGAGFAVTSNALGHPVLTLRQAASITIVVTGLAFAQSLSAFYSTSVYVAGGVVLFVVAGAMNGRWTGLLLPVALVLGFGAFFAGSLALTGDLLEPDADGALAAEWLGAGFVIGLVAAVPATACVAVGVLLSRLASRREGWPSSGLTASKGR